LVTVYRLTALRTLHAGYGYTFFARLRGSLRFGSLVLTVRFTLVAHTYAHTFTVRARFTHARLHYTHGLVTVGYTRFTRLHRGSCYVHVGSFAHCGSRFYTYVRFTHHTTHTVYYTTWLLHTVTWLPHVYVHGCVYTDYCGSGLHTFTVGSTTVTYTTPARLVHRSRFTFTGYTARVCGCVAVHHFRTTHHTTRFGSTFGWLVPRLLVLDSWFTARLPHVYVWLRSHAHTHGLHTGYGSRTRLRTLRFAVYTHHTRFAHILFTACTLRTPHTHHWFTFSPRTTPRTFWLLRLDYGCRFGYAHGSRFTLVTVTAPLPFPRSPVTHSSRTPRSRLLVHCGCYIPGFGSVHRILHTHYVAHTVHTRSAACTTVCYAVLPHTHAHVTCRTGWLVTTCCTFTRFGLYRSPLVGLLHHHTARSYGSLHTHGLRYHTFTGSGLLYTQFGSAVHHCTTFYVPHLHPSGSTYHLPHHSYTPPAVRFTFPLVSSLPTDFPGSFGLVGSPTFARTCHCVPTGYGYRFVPHRTTTRTTRTTTVYGYPHHGSRLRLHFTHTLHHGSRAHVYYTCTGCVPVWFYTTRLLHTLRFRTFTLLPRTHLVTVLPHTRLLDFTCTVYCTRSRLVLVTTPRVLVGSGYGLRLPHLRLRFTTHGYVPVHVYAVTVRLRLHTAHYLHGLRFTHWLPLHTPHHIQVTARLHYTGSPALPHFTVHGLPHVHRLRLLRFTWLRVHGLHYTGLRFVYAHLYAHVLRLRSRLHTGYVRLRFTSHCTSLRFTVTFYGCWLRTRSVILPAVVLRLRFAHTPRFYLARFTHVHRTVCYTHCTTTAVLCVRFPFTTTTVWLVLVGFTFCVPGCTTVLRLLVHVHAVGSHHAHCGLRTVAVHVGYLLHTTVGSTTFGFYTHTVLPALHGYHHGYTATHYTTGSGWLVTVGPTHMVTLHHYYVWLPAHTHVHYHFHGSRLRLVTFLPGWFYGCTVYGLRYTFTPLAVLPRSHAGYGLVGLGSRITALYVLTFTVPHGYGYILRSYHGLPLRFTHTHGCTATLYVTHCRFTRTCTHGSRSRLLHRTRLHTYTVHHTTVTVLHTVLVHTTVRLVYVATVYTYLHHTTLVGFSGSLVGFTAHTTLLHAPGSGYGCTRLLHAVGLRVGYHGYAPRWFGSRVLVTRFTRFTFTPFWFTLVGCRLRVGLVHVPTPVCTHGCTGYCTFAPHHCVYHTGFTTTLPPAGSRSVLRSTTTRLFTRTFTRSVTVQFGYAACVTYAPLLHVRLDAVTGHWLRGLPLHHYTAFTRLRLLTTCRFIRFTHSLPVTTFAVQFTFTHAHTRFAVPAPFGLVTAVGYVLVTPTLHCGWLPGLHTFTVHITFGLVGSLLHYTCTHTRFTHHCTFWLRTIRFLHTFTTTRLPHGSHYGCTFCGYHGWFRLHTLPAHTGWTPPWFTFYTRFYTGYTHGLHTLRLHLTAHGSLRSGYVWFGLDYGSPRLLVLHTHHHTHTVTVLRLRLHTPVAHHTFHARFTVHTHTPLVGLPFCGLPFAVPFWFSSVITRLVYVTVCSYIRLPPRCAHGYTATTTRTHHHHYTVHGWLLHGSGYYTFTHLRTHLVPHHGSTHRIRSTAVHTTTHTHRFTVTVFTVHAHYTPRGFYPGLPRFGLHTFHGSPHTLYTHTDLVVGWFTVRYILVLRFTGYVPFTYTRSHGLHTFTVCPLHPAVPHVYHTHTPRSLWLHTVRSPHAFYTLPLPHGSLHSHTQHLPVGYIYVVVGWFFGYVYTVGLHARCWLLLRLLRSHVRARGVYVYVYVCGGWFGCTRRGFGCTTLYLFLPLVHVTHGLPLYLLFCSLHTVGWLRLVTLVAFGWLYVGWLHARLYAFAFRFTRGYGCWFTVTWFYGLLPFYTTVWLVWFAVTVCLYTRYGLYGCCTPHGHTRFGWFTFAVVGWVGRYRFAVVHAGPHTHGCGFGYGCGWFVRYTFTCVTHTFYAVGLVGWLPHALAAPVIPRSHTLPRFAHYGCYSICPHTVGFLRLPTHTLHTHRALHTVTVTHVLVGLVYG